MPARRHLLLIVIAAAAMILMVSTCGGGDPEAFRGTVVAPLETLAALTPAPAVDATLTAETQPTEAVAAVRPATPTPRPPTPTPRPNTPVPRPKTPTPRPPTPTPRPATPTSPPPTQEAAPTVPGDVYLELPQQVGQLGEVWSLSDIRVGLHPQKVRVVWEMSEARSTIPLAEIVEVDNSKAPFPWRGALIDPSWGAARIDVMISDCSAYQVALNEQLPITLPASSVVTKIGIHPTFDDALLGFSIGLTKPVPYEIYTLTNPVRIVVDVITEP